MERFVFRPQNQVTVDSNHLLQLCYLDLHCRPEEKSEVRVKVSNYLQKILIKERKSNAVDATQLERNSSSTISAEEHKLKNRNLKFNVSAPPEKANK